MAGFRCPGQRYFEQASAHRSGCPESGKSSARCCPGRSESERVAGFRCLGQQYSEQASAHRSGCPESGKSSGRCCPGCPGCPESERVAGFRCLGHLHSEKAPGRCWPGYSVLRWGWNHLYRSRSLYCGPSLRSSRSRRPSRSPKQNPRSSHCPSPSRACSPSLNPLRPVCRLRAWCRRRCWRFGWTFHPHRKANPCSGRYRHPCRFRTAGRSCCSDPYRYLPCRCLRWRPCWHRYPCWNPCQSLHLSGNLPHGQCYRLHRKRCPGCCRGQGGRGS